MERITPPARQAVKAAVEDAAKPRRRWSDGPNYPWNVGLLQDWSIGAHWPALAALAAEEIGTRSALMLEELTRMERDGRIGSGEAVALTRSSLSFGALGRSIQQIVRLASGGVHLRGERIDLVQLTHETLRDRRAELVQRDAEIALDLRPAEVHLDPVLSAQLMNTGLDWALSLGNKVRLKISNDTESGKARLALRVTLPRVADEGGASKRAGSAKLERRTSDNLHWISLRQLAASGKLKISRSGTAGTEAAVIDFGKTYFTAGGLSSVELMDDADPVVPPERWLLAIVPEKSLRETVLKLLVQSGFDAAAAESCDQARLLCAVRKPAVLVACVESGGAEALHKDWAFNGHRCPLIQIAREAHTFHTHGFSGHEHVRISRRELAKQLVPAVLFELAQHG